MENDGFSDGSSEGCDDGSNDLNVVWASGVEVSEPVAEMPCKLRL